jgi:Inositol hexakisphosphate
MKSVKKISLSLILILSLMMSTLLWAVTNNTLLVLDMRNLSQLPKHFRTTSNALPTDINTEGLADLHMAGGAQFSKLALERILFHLRTKRLTVIDLREESHGFLNGNAISWYAPGDAVNAGLTGQQIENRQSRLLDELSRQESVKTYMILSKTPDERIDKTKMIEFSMRGVLSEASLADSLHLSYERLYVQDHHAPTAKQVAHFMQRVKQIPKDQWLYIHCRAGLGRTTTFMAMYDMVHNAKKVSFDDIIARQVALGGKDLTALPQPDSYKYKAASQRLTFLKKFYQYAHDNNDNFKTSWLMWNKKA